MKTGEEDGDRVRIAHEELRVDKRVLETGRVQVRTHVNERVARVREDLAREDVDVEWVEVNREVDAIPEVRSEGDTLIIPVFEEVLVVEKRLVLRKEIRLTRRMHIEPFAADVPLRRVDAEVQRVRPPRMDAQPEETAMTRTLTALYDTREHAEAARRELLDAGLASGDIDISAQEGGAGGERSGSDQGGFLQSVKNFFMPEEDHHTYSEGVRRGGVLLTARVPDEDADRAIDILDTSGAVDLNTREQEWRAAGWQGRTEGAMRRDETDVAVPIAEERLNVGKREVDRGSVRVRSYVVEEPVNEQVTLRDEQVNVERRPVNERLSGSADGLFEERSFEVSEHGEEPVVSKETVVTDELRVSKEAHERTEDVQDTVRRTEVDVDDQRGRAGQDRGPDQPRGF